MTIEELIKAGRIVPVADDIVPVVCVCWRYIGQRCKAGTRLDLECMQCSHRICANTRSQELAAKGVWLICRECLPACERELRA